jgi:hypothetical protein
MNFHLLLLRGVTLVSLCLGVTTAFALDFSDLAAEGEIKYLKVRPDPGAYSYESRVKLTPASLDTGSVEIATCHYQLDPIRKVVIVYNENRIQAIAVKSVDKMASAEVKNNQVILTDVERGASICIDLRSRALDRVGENQYRLNAGPLMRRYFDGYLPMSAKLRIDWPTDMLVPEKISPSERDGVVLVQGNDGMQLDMIFAGKMTAQIYLKKPE